MLANLIRWFFALGQFNKMSRSQSQQLPTKAKTAAHPPVMMIVTTQYKPVEESVTSVIECCVPVMWVSLFAMPTRKQY